LSAALNAYAAQAGIAFSFEAPLTDVCLPEA